MGLDGPCLKTSERDISLASPRSGGESGSHALCQQLHDLTAGKHVSDIAVLGLWPE